MQGFFHPGERCSCPLSALLIASPNIRESWQYENSSKKKWSGGKVSSLPPPCGDSRVSPSSPWAGLVNHRESPSHRPWLFYRYSTISNISMFSPVSCGCTWCFPTFPQAAREQSCLFITQNTQCQCQLGNFLTGLVRHWKKASNHNHIWNKY